MAGEATESWQEVKGTSYMVVARDLFTIMRIAWERSAPIIQLPPPGSLPQHVGVLGDTIQVEIWVGTQLNHISPLFSLTDLSSIPVLVLLCFS